MLTYRINDLVELRLEDKSIGGGANKGVVKETNIYIKGKKFRKCKFLLLNIPTKEVGYEETDIVNIDEASGKYSKKMEHDHSILTPEEEFIGHCSNIEAWVENDYNPDILHSNLSVPLLTKLCGEERKIFDSLLWHLDDNWNSYKTKERKEFILKKYTNLIESAVRKYNITEDECKTSDFISAMYFIRAFRGLKYNVRDKIKKYKQRRVRRIKSKYYYWEKKLFGKDLEHRKLLRRIRDHDNTVVVSDPSDYIPYYIATRSTTAGRLSYCLNYLDGNIIVKDEEGNNHIFTHKQLEH